MPSQAQHIANIANAQLSTGPRTPEGKAQSSQNAVKHGLTARDLVIGAGETEEFHQLLADLQSELQPQGALKQDLCCQLVAAWNLRRVRRLEADYSRGGPHDRLLLPRRYPHRLPLRARGWRHLRDLRPGWRRP